MDNQLSKQASDWREGRRLRAWELKEQGWKQQQIADAMGVTKGAVSQWMKRGREGGVEGLKHRVATGAPPGPGSYPVGAATLSFLAEVHQNDSGKGRGPFTRAPSSFPTRSLAAATRGTPYVSGARRPP